jgi:hypothetical protein
VTVWQARADDLEAARLQAVRASLGAAELQVVHPEGFLGVVPAFHQGTRIAADAEPAPDLVACLHDDCLLQDPTWVAQVVQYFTDHPACYLLGFGGAWGLGEDDCRTAEYRPELLVRKGFMSNMRDAEAHGVRVTTPRRVAVLDGFSLIGRTGFMLHTWKRLDRAGVVHHAYDAAFGAEAAACGVEVHLLPVACHHLGGQTAVGDPRYHAWAATQVAGGDQGFWHQAHRIVWEHWQDQLPIRVPQPEGWGGGGRAHGD